MIIFCTKYALTKGIEQHDAKRITDDGIAIVGAAFPIYFHGEGREWHRDMEKAVERAKHMQKVKIASLKKALARIEGLKF